MSEIIEITDVEPLGGFRIRAAVSLVGGMPHFHELLANWQRARDEQPLEDIDPLP